jgi:cyclophilin family peptidyl-prolyl cis-trans isomerase
MNKIIAGVVFMPMSGNVKPRHTFRLLVFFCLAVAVQSTAYAGTIVRVSTSVGDFSIELLDDTAPVTVENFLGYVNRGDYNQTYIHRIGRDSFGDPFAVQGGAFRFQPFVGPITVPTLAPIQNESKESNTRGTVAMAKLGGNLDSATNQWFVNVVDNSLVLDRILMTINYTGLDEGELVTASFAGDVTISASTVALLAAAISDNPEVANEWAPIDTGNTLSLTGLDLEGEPAIRNFIGAEIIGGDGGETLISGDGGFTVFGTVQGNGMEVVDKIQNLEGITLGTAPFTDSAPYVNETYDSPLDFVYMNVEVVDRVSDSVNVYEAPGQLLIASLTINGIEGALSLNMSLADGGFKINLDSIIRLAETPLGAANFTPADNRLRFPEIEINWGGTCSTLTNVVMVLSNPDQLLFTLESFDQAISGCS